MMKNKIIKIINNLIEKEKSWSCGDESNINYSTISMPRFNKTLEICKRHVPDKNSIVLDIGRSNLTKEISKYYKTIYTLGFDITEDEGSHRETDLLPDIQHIVYNLNDSDNPDSYPEYSEKFDLILFCEVVEHLYIAPEFVLLMLSYLLKPSGTIIVTTPNAISIRKRIKLLFGIHPFEKFRLYSKNPGHYREYTKNELVEIGNKVDLIAKEANTINFKKPIDRIKSIKSIFFFPFTILPQFKDYIVCIFNKAE